MLPKGLYELLPYLYMLCGGWAIIEYGGVAILLGTALFLYGAWVWSIRSDRRRRSEKLRNRASSSPYWNETLYELMPFGYILSGVYMLVLLPHQVRFISGPLMIGTGMLLVLIRFNERRKFTRVMPEPNTNPVDRLELKSQHWPDNLGIATLIPDTIEVHEEPQLVLAPQGQRCTNCTIRDLCAGVSLKNETIGEIMRLAQTVDPKDAFELYHSAVTRIEGREVPESELRPVLQKLAAYSYLCATWRRTGRLGD
ncbi:hypothetical protein [Motiliproteus sediminis]|uniref:hypothetical protein n=1 Tax=Motiliproteus sediminis TaxID=1468178 RepID=UPI001AEF7DD8|nr:hypothetical protein [Motiliproteus sediminis]